MVVEVAQADWKKKSEGWKLRISARVMGDWKIYDCLKLPVSLLVNPVSPVSTSVPISHHIKPVSFCSFRPSF